MAFLEIILILTVAILIAYKWSTSNFQIFRERGIAYSPPLPMLGNVKLDVFWRKSSFFLNFIEHHLKFKDNKVYGWFHMRDPIFCVSDMDLIKQVGIKEFEHFTNHGNLLPDSGDSIFSKILIRLNDRKWKEMRTALTPTFTSSKMRQMYELINAVSALGVEYIKEELKNRGQNEIELEMKDFSTCFTNDVIASAAFGINVNSFKDKNNEFYKIGKSVTNFSTSRMLKMVLFFFLPKLMKALSVKVFDPKEINFFNRLVFGAIKYREENKIIRPDMIHLLMEAKRNYKTEKATTTESDDGEHAEFSDEDLLAQCLLFFLAGFETVATCLAFTTYELLMNPEIQEALYDEILEMENELNGNPLHYDALMKMKYLDMIVSESLRKWPPSGLTDRQCSADVKLTDAEGNVIASLKKNDLVFVPIAGLHHDPDNFPEPHKFDPERFASENKNNIKQFTYLPFGIGPRACIGNRFALMEVKSLIYHLVLHFKLEPASKTVKDMLNSIDGFTMQPKELFWTKYVTRTKT